MVDDDGDDNEAYTDNRRAFGLASTQLDASQDDVDRLNLWSAYRFMNNNGGYGGGYGGYSGGYPGVYNGREAPPLPLRSGFYPNLAPPTYVTPEGYSGYAGVYPVGPRGLYVGAGAGGKSRLHH